MADQGAIGYKHGSPTTATISLLGKTTPVDWSTIRLAFLPPTYEIRGAEQTLKASRVTGSSIWNLSLTSTAKVISGIVKEAGTEVAGRWVICLRQDNFAFLGKAISGSGGVFSISTHGYTGNVVVFALDDTGAAPSYNAKVYAQVTPV